MEIQRGGSLLLAWQVKGKRVLVVGGGEVASGRIVNLLNADAVVTVVCPSSGLNPDVAEAVSSGLVTHVDRCFLPSDLDDDPAMVLTAIDSPEDSSAIWKLCKARRIPANIADVPSECDFYFGSVHRDGPLQIMVSTNGNGPKVASIVRKRIAASLPPNAGRAISRVGELRRKLRARVPDIDQGPTRMAWMSRVCVDYSLDELCEVDLDTVLEGYPHSTGREGYTFDGSFGWAV